MEAWDTQGTIKLEARISSGATEEPVARNQLVEEQVARSNKGEGKEVRSLSKEAWERPAALDSTQQCTPRNLALSESTGAALVPQAGHSEEDDEDHAHSDPSVFELARDILAGRIPASDEALITVSTGLQGCMFDHESTHTQEANRLHQCIYELLFK